MAYSKIRPDWLLQKLAYSAQTLHDEWNNCFCQLDLVKGSILESHAKNRTKIGHFSWILGPSQNLMKILIFERLWESMREVWWGDREKQQISGVNFFKFHQKNAPNSMKNVRFWSGFLLVILKLIPQQDGIYSYLTHRAKQWALQATLPQQIRPYLRVGHGRDFIEVLIIASLYYEM